MGDRIDELVEPDLEKYRKKARDVRLDTPKMSDLGIRFETSEVAVSRALGEFGLVGTFG